MVSGLEVSVLAGSSSKSEEDPARIEMSGPLHTFTHSLSQAL